jgi:hypothetical protein
MLINNSTGSILSLLTIDTTTAAPQNAATNILVITGTGGIAIPSGTTLQQPTHAAGLLRYNTTDTNFEFSNGVAWNTIARFTDIAATITSSYVRTTLGLDSVYLQSANLSAAVTSQVTQGYITTLVDPIYVNVSGDTMTGFLTLNASPTTSLHAATKAYVDGLSTSGTTWHAPITDSALIDVVTAVPGTPVTDTTYIKFGGTQNETWGALTNVVDNDILTWSGTAWVRISTLVAGQRFLIAGEYGTIGAGLSGVGFVNKDLVQYVSGSPALFASWSLPDGRGLGGTPGTQMITGVTVLVNDNLSLHYGHTYLYNATANTWLEIAGPGSIGAGTGLHYVGTTLTLDIPVTTPNGGTGLTAVGSSNQVLGVVNASGSLEYKSIVGTASQIGVTHTANTITLTNLGLLSIAASTGTTGLTLTPTTTTGAVTQVLAGTLAVANGGTALTAAPTNGQLLIGNGTGYTLAALTASTGISVTNTSGSITIANTGVTSVGVSGGTTGLTTSGGPITTTGTITLAGTLAATNGGTGQSALGTANQVLGINAGATATEYKTVTAGTAVSVVNTAGVLTINNTGVTSAIAGTGIGVSSSTGAVTISNTGVTNIILSTVSPTGGGTNKSGVLINGVQGTTTLATGSVTTTGTITVSLSNELQSLTNLSSSGMLSANAGTYVSRSLVTGATSTIVVTNGDGIAGNPTFDLNTVGTPVTTSFVKITTDVFGRISGTTAVLASDITPLVDATYVNVTGDTMSGTLTFTSGTVTGLTTPVNASDAVPKSYVDAAIQGLTPKQSVRVATITSGTLATSFANASTIDGITLATNDRILIKNQVAPAENGIYIVNATGAPTRALDMDVWTEVPNAYVFVSVGTQADTGWVCTSDAGGTLGTTAITFVQFSGAGSYSAGTGLTLTGTQFSITAPISTTLGGTGLTAVGSPHQLLAMNGAGTALLYTNIAGTNISIDSSVAGTLTLVNTGVIATSGGTTGLTLTTTGTTGLTATLGGTLVIANGGTGLATAPTTDQVLIGTAGGAYSLSTLTAGTGVGITNSTGVLTINNTGIVSVAGDIGTTTGLVLTANTVSGATTLALSGTLRATHGGTGLTSTGISGQILGVSATTGVLEYKTLTAGTGITIDSTTTPGVITIASSGGSVTSVALAAPSIFTVSGSPVTSTGTLSLALNTQAANLVFAGPSTGTAAGPTFRTLVYADLPIALYKENPSTPAANTATGVNSVAIGSGASATGVDAIAIGTGSSSSHVGGVAIANGGTAGSAQTGIYVLRNTSTTASVVNLYLDGTTSQIVLANNSMMAYSITIAAFGGTDQGAYKIEGAIIRGANAASTASIGSNKTVLLETTGAQPWDVALVADTTNGALQIQVTGAAATTIKWVATVVTTEVM